MMQFLSKLFSWMNWTVPSGIFIGGIFLSIALIAIYEEFNEVYETAEGFLPIPTTPGDKFFISILYLIAVFLLWLAFFEDNFLGVMIAIEIIGVAMIVWKG